MRPSAGVRTLCLGAALLLVLAGCSSSPPAPPVPPPPAEWNANRDLAPPPPDPGDNERRARVRLDLADAYFERGQLDTALDEVKRALQAKPDFGDALAMRGLIYAAMDQPQLAEESFRRALQVSPQDGTVMNSYAWFLCQRDRLAEADAMFQQALAQPQYRDMKRTLHARGVCLSRAGRWLEAERALMRAYELEPSNPLIGFNLAEVLYERKEYERARFYIGRVNDAEGASNAQTLWLAARIANKLGDTAALDRLGRQMRSRFPLAPQTVLFDRGQFDG